MSEKILLVGGFIEIIELCEENNIEIIGIIDKDKTGHYYSIPIIGGDGNISNWIEQYKGYKLVITPDSPTVRKKLYATYNTREFDFYSIISQKSRISKTSAIEKGTIIQSGVNISSEVKIGKFVKVNNYANIMHNTTVGDFSTIAPNAVLLGNVTIGESCYIGANATILPNITICENVTIGAGAVVSKNIFTPNSKYAGVPAKLLTPKQ